jgi:hypothetical protein
MLRRLLIGGLVVIVVGVVALDRVGARVAAHVLAGKLQTYEHLPNRPSASIGGIPFLTQAFGGDYHDVHVTARDFKTPDGVPVTTLDAHLRGARLPLSDVLDGSVSKVPVDHVQGTVYVSFADVAAYLTGEGTSVTLGRASDHTIKVTRKIPLGGNRTGVAVGVATVTVSNQVVKLAVGQIDATSIVGGKSGRTFLVRPFTLSVPLRALPFRIDVTSVTVSGEGVTAAGTANDVTLGS